MLPDIKSSLAQRAERKVKRAAKRIELGLDRPKRKRVNYRKRAFKALKDKLKEFVRARAVGGMCQVALVCGGVEPGVLVYHIFPAKSGNGVKYDHRNLLWACRFCNMGEYGDRCRGAYDRWDQRHKAILGEALWAELKSLQGRRQISTTEAKEMTSALAKPKGSA